MVLVIELPIVVIVLKFWKSDDPSGTVVLDGFKDLGEVVFMGGST